MSNNIGEVFMKNFMILNNENIGISYAELNEDEVLLYNNNSKYCFKVYLNSNGNWKDIYNLKIGEKRQIEFSEYGLSENNIPALIFPTISYVEKPNDYELLFYFKCENFNDIVFMSFKNHFDIELNNLEIQILFNLKDFKNNRIIYKF